jgi:hypothetical protein
MNAAGSGPAATGIEGASAPAIKITDVARKERRNMAVIQKRFGNSAFAQRNECEAGYNSF